MVTALVTALGAVIVAMVAIVGVRVEARDARTRIVKDVEIMLKLDPKSDARTILEKHVAESAVHIAASERRRWEYRAFWRLYAIGVGVGVISFAIKIGVGASQKPPVEFLRTFAPTLANLLLAFSFLSFALCCYALFKVLRERRRKTNRAKQVSDNGQTV